MTTRCLRAIAVVLSFTATPVAAIPDGGAGLERAQELAWSGRREEAREICHEILARNPNDNDVRVLLARTLAWDHRFDEARDELVRVLESDPGYIDAYRALADVELWADRYDRALEVAERGLERQPLDVELRYRRAQALAFLGRYREARAVAGPLASEYPDEDRFRFLDRKAHVESMTRAIEVGYRYEDFQQFSEPWKEWTVEFKNRFAWGPLYARIRHARRFGATAQQYEVDAYPRLPARMYVYLNAGWAPHEPFPVYRLGAELFGNFAEGWEASAGFRYLAFDGSSVPVYTGSVNKYYRDYWISLRPTVTDRNGRRPVSWALTVRRYFADPETWIGWTFSFGSKTDPALNGNEDARLDASRYNLSGQLKLSDVWRLSGYLGYRDQDIAPGRSRQSVVGSISVSRKF